MKLFTLPILVSTSVLLTACGGGSGSGGTANNSVTASSVVKSSSPATSASSTASSSTAELGCSFHETAVYIDAACSPWQSPSVREKNGDGSVGQEVDAKQSQALSLSELDVQESAHQRVLDIHYNKTAANSQLRFGVANTAGLDLSAYQTGKLVFDLRVINKGDKNAPLQIALDCGWPCESTERNIDTGALNEWKTIEVPIADFIRDGLNIKQVRSGFQIMPALNQQTNVHFQLDNIRWEKGQPTQPVAESCHSIHFDSTASTSLSLRSFTGHKLPTLVGQVPTSIIKPEWSSPQERWGYGEQTLNLDETCLTNPASTFSASVYIPGAYVTDGKLRVGFYFADADNSYITAGLTSAAQLVPDSWNTIAGKLPQTLSKARAVSAKPSANKVGFSHWGIVFDANGKDPAITGDVRIDNIVISQSPEASSSSISQNQSSASNSANALSSSGTPTSNTASSTMVVSSSSSLMSSGVKSSSKSSVRSSSVASSTCIAGSGSYSGNATLGFGVAVNSFAYLRVELNNSTFIGSPNVSIPNASLTTVMSNNAMVVLQITPSQFLSSSTLIDLGLDFQQQDAQLKVSRSVELYVTLADAANRTNALFSSSADIASPCSFRASSSRSSQASTLASSSLVSSAVSSASSSVAVTSSSTPVASSSSVATSTAVSSSAAAVTSAASSAATSQASSSACAAGSGTHSGSVPLGFGFPSDSVAFLRIDLINGKLTSDPIINLPNATSIVAMSDTSMIIYHLNLNAAISSSTPVDISLGYQQQNPFQKVTRTVTLYSTSPNAINGVNALSSSSIDIVNPACP